MNSDDLDVPELWEMMQAELPTVCDVVREDISAFIDNELPPPAHEGCRSSTSRNASRVMSSFKETNTAQASLLLRVSNFQQASK